MLLHHLDLVALLLYQMQGRLALELFQYRPVLYRSPLLVSGVPVRYGLKDK